MPLPRRAPAVAAGPAPGDEGGHAEAARECQHHVRLQCGPQADGGARGGRAPPCGCARPGGDRHGTGTPPCSAAAAALLRACAARGVHCARKGALHRQAARETTSSALPCRLPHLQASSARCRCRASATSPAPSQASPARGGARWRRCLPSLQHADVAMAANGTTLPCPFLPAPQPDKLVTTAILMLACMHHPPRTSARCSRRRGGGLPGPQQSAGLVG